jgi:23S rRNA-/tRNA-specific pseudouridylate synthase
VKSGSDEKPLISRLPLHAAALTFRMPMSGEERTFEAVLPNDFEVAIKQLRKYGK